MNAVVMEVEQVDRDAAADLAAQFQRYTYVQIEAPAIRRGDHDDWEMVLAFARHRTEALSGSRGEGFEFNVNSNVWVKLTDTGCAMHKADHAKYGGLLGEYREPETDADGWHKIQLWDLMHTYGSGCYNGAKVPFETTIRLSEPRPSAASEAREIADHYDYPLSKDGERRLNAALASSLSAASEVSIPVCTVADYNAVFDPADEAGSDAYTAGFREGWIFAQTPDGTDYDELQEAYGRQVDIEPSEAWHAYRDEWFKHLPLAALPTIGEALTPKASETQTIWTDPDRDPHAYKDWAGTPKASEVSSILRKFVMMEKSIMADLRTAHNRGPGSTEEMRDDDREMRDDLHTMFNQARAALDQLPLVEPASKVSGRESGFNSAITAIRSWAAGFYDQANQDRLRAVAQDLQNNRDEILGNTTPKASEASGSREAIAEAVDYATRWLANVDLHKQIATPFPKETMRLLLLALSTPPAASVHIKVEEADRLDWPQKSAEEISEIVKDAFYAGAKHRERNPIGAYDAAAYDYMMSVGPLVMAEAPAASVALEVVERLKEARQRFADACASLPWVAEKIAKGQQFNAYDSASNDEDDEDYDLDFYVGIGPITDFRTLCDVTGRAQANLIEAALKLAALSSIDGERA